MAEIYGKKPTAVDRIILLRSDPPAQGILATNDGQIIDPPGDPENTECIRLLWKTFKA